MLRKKGNLLILQLTCVLLATVSSSYDETQLFKHLFDDSNYDPRVCPARSTDESLQINISVHMIKLQEVNTKHQYISILGWITAEWIDYRLTWNSTDYSGLDTITVPTPNVWVPTFVLANSASENLYNEFWYTLFKVIVQSDGSMKWTTGGIFKADCPIDVHFFPFDEQICQFRFENWVYTGDKVNLTYVHRADEKFLDFYSVENGQWEILDVAVARQDKYYLTSKPFPRVFFGIHLQRKSLFYVTNIILLSSMLAVLVLFIFKLPAESGERISMGVTLLLSFSVFILIINDNIPETSSAVPIIITYLISLMFLTTVGICESVFILYCYHQDGETRAPICMIKFFITSPCCRKDKLKSSEGFKMTEDNGENAEVHSSGKSIDSQELCKLEWQQISRGIDIFCFWMFIVIILLLILVLLFAIPAGLSYKNLDDTLQEWLDEK